MRALTWRGPLVQELDDIPVPEVGHGEVLVAVERAGICGSDVTAHKGTMGTGRPGMVRGHEFAGTIAASDTAELEAGTRVAVNPVVTCGRCPACERGRHSACPFLQIIGVHRPGAFAEYVTVPAVNARAIADSLPWEAAALAEPLAQAIHDVALATVAGGLGRCAVIGSGSIGLFVVDTLRLRHVSHIAVADPDTRRREAAGHAGAHDCTATANDLPAESFDTVFDIVGNTATRRDAIALARNGGQVVAVGLGTDEAPVPWFDLIRREITVRGANCFTPDDFAQAIQWFTDGVISIPSHRLVRLEDGVRLFGELAAGNDSFPGKTFLSL